jgi:6-phosphogluconate dehydrogenase
LLEIFINLFDKQPAISNVLLDETVASLLLKREQGWRDVVCTATQHAYAVPALSACLSYFDAYRTARLPANLLQAQRDYFGAHTYERIDEAGVFHTNWGKSTEP